MSGCRVLKTTPRMVKETNWKVWLERLYSLRRDKRGSHERPHKPALLLRIIDLLDRGVLTGNQIPLTDDLMESFRRHFEIVRQPSDQPTIKNPFFHLSGDGFWHLNPKPGEGLIYRADEARGSPSLGELRRRVAFGRFDEGLWTLLRDAQSRREIREALVDRYFPIGADHHVRSSASE